MKKPDLAQYVSPENLNTLHQCPAYVSIHYVLSLVRAKSWEETCLRGPEVDASSLFDEAVGQFPGKIYGVGRGREAI